MTDALSVNNLKSTFRDPSPTPPSLTIPTINVITIVISVVSLVITIIGFYFGWKAYTEIMENIKPQLNAIINHPCLSNDMTRQPQKSTPEIIRINSH